MKVFHSTRATKRCLHQRHIQISRALFSKKTLRLYDQNAPTFLHKSGNKYQGIWNELQRAKHPSDYIEYLDKNKKIKVLDASIYGKAMQLCTAKKHYHGIKKIMDIMLRQITDNNGIQIENVNAIVFNIFFNAMAKADEPDVAYRYFKIMTHDLNIMPDTIVLATLMKSCREQGRYNLAEIYWKLLENTDNINHFHYHEMISV